MLSNQRCSSDCSRSPWWSTQGFWVISTHHPSGLKIIPRPRHKVNSNQGLHDRDGGRSGTTKRVFLDAVLCGCISRSVRRRSGRRLVGVPRPAPLRSANSPSASGSSLVPAKGSSPPLAPWPMGAAGLGRRCPRLLKGPKAGRQVLSGPFGRAP